MVSQYIIVNYCKNLLIHFLSLDNFECFDCSVIKKELCAIRDQVNRLLDTLSSAHKPHYVTQGNNKEIKGNFNNT